MLYIIPCGSIQTGYQDVLVGEEICGEGLGCSFGMFACIKMYTVMFISTGLRIPFRFFNCISYNRYGSETGIQVICHILVIIDIPVLQFGTDTKYIPCT